MDVQDATARLLERIDHTAAWREGKAEQYPDDERNAATIALETRRQVIARHGFDRADATTDDLLAALVAETEIAETDSSHQDDAEAIREARIRRKVAHQGLHLKKSHTHEPHAPDYGRYLLTDDQGRVVGEGPRGKWMTLTEIQGWLTDRE